jgi:hypothetical protein
VTREIRDRLAEQYETLRRQVLEEGAVGGLGLALLRCRGLAAWMKAWAECAPPEMAHQQTPRAGRDTEGGAPLLSTVLATTAAVVVAQMIFNRTWEAPAC